MEWDDDEHEDASEASFGAPLPPEDRLWRHPAEVAAEARLTSTTTVRTSWTKTLTVAGASALGSAALVAGLFLALDPRTDLPAAADVPDLTDNIVEVRTTQVPLIRPAVSVDEWPALVAESAASGVAEVIVHRGGETVAGSGFVFRPDGQLLTSHDLVAGADRYEVVFAGGARFDADLVGADARSGIAVLDVDGSTEQLEILPLGLLTEPPRIGADTLVLAGGADPASLTPSRLSAVDSELQLAGQPDLYGVLQLDKPLPQGASGAPVIDTTGEVIGVALGVGPRSGTVVVPIGWARLVADNLDRYDGRAHHTWLGIEGRTLSAERAEDLAVVGGVEVATVIDESPAQTSGLEVGDVIVGVDGTEIVTMGDLIHELRRRTPGTSVEIDIVHRSDHRTVLALLDAQ